MYDLIELKYPAISNDNQCEIKEFKLSSTEETIKFISDNNIVFFHAIKLFNIYCEKIFHKVNQSTKFLTETTFHNYIKINDNYGVCLYGSIDLLFYEVNNDILKYLYK